MSVPLREAYKLTVKTPVVPELAGFFAPNTSTIGRGGPSFTYLTLVTVKVLEQEDREVQSLPQTIGVLPAL